MKKKKVGCLLMQPCHRKNLKSVTAIHTCVQRIQSNEYKDVHNVRISVAHLVSISMTRFFSFTHIISCFFSQPYIFLFYISIYDFVQLVSLLRGQWPMEYFKKKFSF